MHIESGIKKESKIDLKHKPRKRTTVNLELKQSEIVLRKSQMGINGRNAGNIQIEHESLILAQDERWRRA